MKRIIALLFLPFLLCALSACNTSLANLGGDHADWVHVSSDVRRGALSDQGYYYLQNNHVLSFADFASGTTVALCARVGCSHDSETCDGYLQTCDAMFFGNAHLYYIVNGVLYQRSATGSNLQEVGTLGLSYIQEGNSVAVKQYALLGEHLYYMASITGTVQNDDGVYVTSQVAQCIGRVNLSNGNDEILLENQTKDISITTLCAVKKNSVLVYERGQITLDREDPGYVEAGKTVPITLKELDLQTGETREVFKKSTQECGSVFMVFEGKVYYKALGDGSIYARDLTTGEENLFYTTNFPTLLGGGYILDRGSDSVEPSLISFSTQTELPYELNCPGPPAVRAMSEKGFVCEISYVEDVDEENERYTKIYYFVPYETLMDGLQEMDLKQLYVDKTWIQPKQ